MGATVLACDKNEECIADCDPADASGGTPPPMTAACADDTEAAAEFIAENNACETVLDCVQADGICYHGEGAGPCGGVGLSASADLDAWAALADDLAQTCECGAPACGSTVMCTDAGDCESVFGSEDYCPSIARDVQTFLDANKSCETDEDCQIIESICHVDDCSGVTVNNGADVDAWLRLDLLLFDCDVEIGVGEYCNFVGECGFTAVCDEQGQCSAER